jgi:uncharacterized membrane protein (TIGR01666 family)
MPSELMIKDQTKEVQLFFFSQSLADGLRITLAVLLPSLISYYFNLIELGMTISLGALCVSLVDAPGPILHRRNTMLFCLLFVFIVVIITAFARLNIYLMGLEILLFSFFFSMFTVYGLRAIMVGNATLLAMVLTMDRPIEPTQVLWYALLIVFGGIWYILISLVSYHIRPYRTAQRTLGESIRELSIFLSIKGDFYNVETDINENFKKLIAQQAVVSEKQDAVREILFKTRQIVSESTEEGRKLVLAFVNTVDLFENITASYYNYEVVRQRYGQSGVLDDIYSIAKKLAVELNKTGIAIYANAEYKNEMNYDTVLLELKNKIERIEKNDPNDNKLVLKKLLVNVRKIMQAHNDLLRYFSPDPSGGSKRSSTTHSKFVTHQSLDPKIFWSNLNFSSSAFRHALRVAIACIAGFAISKFIAYGYHSYWILMTIAFMLKPAYSLTRQRNVERVAGTLIGGVIGFVLLLIALPTEALFVIMVFLMIATYSFQRIKYLVSVICMTPFLLILFHFLGGEFIGVLKERVFDTVAGCTIALLAGYLLFPKWESEGLNIYLQSMLQANLSYLKILLDALHGKTISITEYKLARKEVHISSANLSAAFQRMLSEPKSKQKNKNEIHQFVVLNHTVFSNIATIASTVLSRKQNKYSESIIRTAKKAYHTLLDSFQKFEEPITGELFYKDEEENNATETIDDLSLKEQLEFIYKLTVDIKKTTEKIIAS